LRRAKIGYKVARIFDRKITLGNLLAASARNHHLFELSDKRSEEEAEVARSKHAHQAT